MTRLYFIRHAKSDFSVKAERERPLTPAGHQSAKDLTGIFQGISLDQLYSSPYLRTLDTLRPLAKDKNLTISQIENLREREIGRWVEDFEEFSKNQWADFSYKLDGGEALSQVQERNIAIIKDLIHKYPDKSLGIGTHGTALSTIVTYYQPDLTPTFFQKIKTLMPYVIRLDFEAGNYVGMEEIYPRK